MELYDLYKKRWRIETFFNYFKNNVDIHALEVEDYYMTQGLSFIMLIVGMIHSDMNLVVKGIAGKSVDDCLLASKFAKVHKMENRWRIANVKKELKETMEHLHIDFEEEIVKINRNEGIHNT